MENLQRILEDFSIVVMNAIIHVRRQYLGYLQGERHGNEIMVNALFVENPLNSMMDGIA